MIVLKISCNGEIHRIQLDGTADYQFVCQSVQDLFPSSAIQGIKYVDEEGDLCTLVDATFTDFLQTAQEGGYERKMLKVQVTCMPRALGWQKGQHTTRLADDDRWICAKCDEPNCAEREMCNNCGVTKVAAQADKLIGVWGFGSSGKRRVYEIKAFGGALVLQQKTASHGNVQGVLHAGRKDGELVAEVADVEGTVVGTLLIQYQAGKITSRFKPSGREGCLWDNPNVATKESPADFWESAWSKEFRRLYYFNHATKKSVWTKPKIVADEEEVMYNEQAKLLEEQELKKSEQRQIEEEEERRKDEEKCMKAEDANKIEDDLLAEWEFVELTHLNLVNSGNFEDGMEGLEAEMNGIKEHDIEDIPAEINRIKAHLSSVNSGKCEDGMEDIQAEIDRIKAACEAEVDKHLGEWLLSNQGALAYEDWIAAVHPENVKGSSSIGPIIDSRMYLERSFHRKLWNTRTAELSCLSAAEKQRCQTPPR